MQTTVSAIITTYNYGRFIAGAIDSVLNQTRRPDEVVVVDDGSTDDTASIVAGYESHGVRYIYQPNAGAGAARNMGIQATSGKLIAFLDADDRWLPNKLELQLAHLRRHPTAGLITGSEWQINLERQGELDAEPPVLFQRKPLGAANLYRQLLVENTLGNPSIVLVKRACFERAGLFDEGLRLGQDWDMWIRIARVCRVGVVDAPLLNFNFHSGSLTAGQREARIASNREIRRRYIDRVRSPLARLQLLRAATSMSHFYAAASMSDDLRLRSSALRLAAIAFLLDPTYETKLKAALLFRVLVGRRAFQRIRDIIRPR
ncbi:MAG: glycosyltransferase [Chloroflexota bacterium]|nr:glycosyltransferase [Chloroflexota bacterium]MDQ5867112.1 glycosyltransferase [Chloroflexota bacterium]